MQTGERSSRGEHPSCDVVHRACIEVDLMTAQLNRSYAGAVYEMFLNRECLCHKAS